MKKRKTYEISVIDKTYSKIISDETKFYTSDTALELGFELKETEYNFESAEIVLLNVDDRSLATRTVSKVNNGFVYEIDDDITTHYGDWRGQLMLVEKGEVHVSSPIKFRIENDLYCNKPLEIIEVVSWVSLKKYANVLVDELKQAVDEALAKVETMDETFKANELNRDKAEKERQSRFESSEKEREKGESVRVETFKTNEQNRQSQFNSAEQSRQTTFETNESERDETFNTNETTRQAQELEREKAETKRQVVFDGNEASRTETFNANEATRQKNETTRQQAESQRQSTFEANESERQNTFETAEQERQSAEHGRIENENQRKVDHENRSAELDGKANKKQEDWITVPLFNGAQHGTSPLKVMKDEMGFVHFKGSLTNLVNGYKVFSLPIGYRPDIGATEGYIRVPVALSERPGANVVQINYIGDGYTNNSSSTVVTFFDGVSYLAKRG